MKQDRDLTAIERDLNRALIAFNMSRGVLSAKLSNFAAREGAEDRLINMADEYGPEHVLDVMRDNPALLELARAASPTEIEELRKSLTAAYASSHDVSKLNSEKQMKLREADPTLPKAVMVNGRPMVYDPERNVAYWMDTGEDEDMDHEDVSLEHNYDDEEEEERGM
ncbi:hypothetical protein [Hyphomicrobium sp. DY-1]|uniref:hypothetical protein n=1 Tax=Hyphomicrobium sp. DY-1 TaxID=3075650 RepID=UPI0039C42F37